MKTKSKKKPIRWNYCASLPYALCGGVSQATVHGLIRCVDPALKVRFDSSGYVGHYAVFISTGNKRVIDRVAKVIL